METLNCTLSEADIQRRGDTFYIVMKFDYGKMKRKPYLPKKWKLVASDSIIYDLIDICGKSWSNVKNAPIRIKCDYGEVIAIGHTIKDMWINALEAY